MTEQHARIEIEGPVITVTIDRGAKLNAISQSITDTLWEAARQLGDREDLRVMVIRAFGKYFTAGIDLQGDFNHSLYEPAELHGMTFRRKYRAHHLLYDEFEAIEKPIILAAQGPCLGAGVEMSTSCDFRFASTEATFGLPEVRLGSVAGSGGATRLTRLLGPHWAKWMSMAGQTVDAQTALRIGLVHEVVAPERLHGRVHEFALELAALPAHAVGLSKLVIDAAVDADRTTQRHLDRIAVTTLFDTPEVDEYRARFER